MLACDGDGIPRVGSTTCLLANTSYGGVQVRLMKITQRTFVLTLAVIALLGFSANNASAQNDGNVSLSTGIDFVNDYYFRGIVQETKGSISQPYIEAGLAINDTVSLTAGTWQSLHSEQLKTSTVPSWYESDFYAGIGFGAEAVGIDITYTKYMSPRGSWGSVKELAFGVSYDTLVAPYATVAVEFDSGGGADGGSNDGTYFELGIEPGTSLGSSDAGISFPVAIGMSGSNYYEATNGGSFGFFSVGASIGVPLSGIPSEYGAWDFGIGLSAMVVGEALQSINGSTSSVMPLFSFGFSVGY